VSDTSLVRTLLRPLLPLMAGEMYETRPHALLMCSRFGLALVDHGSESARGIVMGDLADFGAPRQMSWTRAWSGRVAERILHARRDWSLVVLDIAVVVGCLATLLLARHGGDVPERYWHGYLIFAPVVGVLFVSGHQMAGLYGRLWRYAGIDEARRMLCAGLATSVVVCLLDVLLLHPVAQSVAVGSVLLATMIVGTTRFQARLFAFHRAQESSGIRLVMLGAGDTGARLLRQLREAPGSGITPVAVLDDDPDKWGRTCVGLRVQGGFADLAAVARANDAHQALLAVPGAPASLIRRLADLAEEADIVLRVLPEPAERLHTPYRVRDARAVAIDDLLGRQPVDTDISDLAEALHDRLVLVTGGGGSIGSEVVRQVAALGPRELLVLDHDETHLYDVLNELPSRVPGSEHVRVTPVLTDIRDRMRVADLLSVRRPDVVIHAAAHKHVPMLEAHPREAALTNVLGTQHLVDAAAAADVGTFVMVSTDKAAHATSVMGASKWLAEQIVLDRARRDRRRWCAVRFGNVLGSRGSVVPLFTRQIAAGGPVTVTDPRMTRYFMTIPEAVQLVLHAAAMAEVGDLFLLDMGKPVRILDLAKRMIRLAGYRLGEDIEIRIIGKRPGEQDHELLTTAAERTEKTLHPSIDRVLAPNGSHVDLADVLSPITRACELDDHEGVRRALLQAVSLVRSPERPHLYLPDSNPPLVHGLEPAPHPKSPTTSMLRRDSWNLSTTYGL
jgi:FlaA1/EpsC-like NDP-sugar epimerase